MILKLILKKLALPGRRGYVVNLLAVWVYTLLWVGALTYAVTCRISSVWGVEALVAVLLFIFVPDLGDLFESYRSYQQRMILAYQKGKKKVL